MVFNSLHLLQLDLASYVSIQQAVADFKSRETRLHVLYCNAGCITAPSDAKTADGFEIRFGVSILGHHIFTLGILAILKDTAKEEGVDFVRIIGSGSNSAAQCSPKELRFNELDEGKRLPRKVRLLLRRDKFAGANR